MENFEEFILAYVREKQLRIDTDVDTLIARFRSLSDKYAISLEALGIAVYNYPALINAHPIIVDKKFALFNELFKISAKQFGQMISLYPPILNLSSFEIYEKINAWKEKLELSDEEVRAFLVKAPNLLSEETDTLKAKLFFTSMLTIDKKLVKRNPRVLLPAPRELARKIAICDYFHFDIDQFVASNAFMASEKRLFARASYLTEQNIALLTASEDIFKHQTNVSDKDLIEFSPITAKFETFYKKYYETKLTAFNDWFDQQTLTESTDHDDETPAEI